MMRSLFSAVSGLKAHQTKMDVIGNNIANVGKGIIRNGETDMTFPDNGSNEAFEIVFFVHTHN